MRWPLIVLFICISLMIGDTEYLFICLLDICISSLEKCLFKSFAHILIAFLIFLLLSFRSPLYVLDISPLSDIWFPNIFSHPLGYLFYSVDIVFSCAQFFNFHEVQFVYFCFVFCAFGVIAKISLPNPMLWRFCPMFSSKSFLVLGLTFRSLIHFQLTFVYDVR